jgi:Fic family protein
VAQPSGYRAFIPSRLPPSPAVRIDGELQRHLSEADRALGRLDGSVHTLPNPDLFVYMNKPVLYLSHYFKAHRQEYYDCLQAVRASGDWERWLEFFLRGVTEVSVQAADTARRILLLREEHRSLIGDRLGRAAGNGHRILQHLYQHPIVSAKDVQNVIGTTFAAANQIVHRLVDIGVLSEITGQARHRRFRYEAYVRLFNDERSDQPS